MGSEQVYFSCFTASFSEDRHEADDVRQEQYRHQGRLLLNPPSGSLLLPWIVWSRLVELYSLRSTSVETDWSSAFQGIRNEQRQTWKMHFVEDMPVDFLPLALLWFHRPSTSEPWKALPKRIPNMASWTWTGWTEEIHSIHYERYRSFIDSTAIRTTSGCVRYHYVSKGLVLPMQRPSKLEPNSNSPRASNKALDAPNETRSNVCNTASSVPVLSFQSQCVTLEAVADMY